MSKYKFRLEPVQRLREARRDQARVALAEALRAEQLLADGRDELTTEKNQLRAVQRAAAADRYLDVNRLLEAQRYEVLLAAREQELAKRSALVAAEIERRRRALVEADRDVRVLELLQRRRRGEHDRRVERLETKQLDEAAAARWRSQ